LKWIIIIIFLILVRRWSIKSKKWNIYTECKSIFSITHFFFCRLYWFSFLFSSLCIKTKQIIKWNFPKQLISYANLYEIGSTFRINTIWTGEDINVIS
jgi:hypothetical protein